MSHFRSLELVRGNEGFGFTISGQAPCFVSWIIENSVADSIGLNLGDFIISINGQNVYDASHEKVVKLIGMSSDLLRLEVEVCDECDSLSSDEEETLTPTQFSSIKNVRRCSQDSSHSKSARQGDSNRGISRNRDDSDRTERVLKELNSGALFKEILTALDTNMMDVESNKSSLKSRHRHNGNGADQKSMQNAKSNRKPTTYRNGTVSERTNFNNVFVQSVLAYLGTVEITVAHCNDIPHASLSAIQACVQQLRREQHIHQRVLLKIMQSCVKLYNADGDVIAVYDGHYICFSSSCPEDHRFFCIVTSTSPVQARCHQFMVDPDICAHRNHLEKAKRFGIHCSMDTDSGNCLEFPKSPKILIKMVEALFIAHESTTETQSITQVAAVQTPPTATETGDVSTASVSTNDSGIEGLNGSAPHSQNNVVSNTPDKSKRQREVTNTKLSHQNLKKHDLKNNMAADGKVDHYMAAATHLPPSTQQSIGQGIYRADTLPAKGKNGIHGSQSLISHEVRRSKRGRKNNKSNESLFFRVPKRSSSRHLRLNLKGSMSKSSESIAVPDTGGLSGASSIESLASNASLPSCFNGSVSGPNLAHRNSINTPRVALWDVSFDRLLEDPLGMKYFTEFLRKEFSQENILFWLECEKLRKTPPTDIAALTEISESIYNRFLSVNATSPVNIDSKGQRLAEEAKALPPTPTMFDLQQNQIYKLMKLDSYSRFLKSPLYRQCVLCEMKDVPLPLEENSHDISQNGVPAETRHSFSFKHRRFFHRSSNKSQKSQGSNDSIHRDSSDSESGFLDAMSNPMRFSEDLFLHGLPSGADNSKICRLTLWDGTSTVMWAGNCQMTIREALGGLCERKGVPLSAIDVYYYNEDRALALDQDVSVLAGQDVRVERRTLFRLDMVPIGRSVGVKAKPTKPIGEVLKPVVAKYGLRLENLQTRLNGEKTYLDLSLQVHVLDSLRVCVDNLPSKDGSDKSKKGRGKEGKTKESHKSFPDKSDTEDLINIMSAAQSSKLHDQRGLLSEMNLELPDFLKTPAISSGLQAISVGEANKNASNNVWRQPNEVVLDIPVVKIDRVSSNGRERTHKPHRLKDIPLPIPPAGGRLREMTQGTQTDGKSSDMPSLEIDSFSSAEDDPFIINKWMQSVSCTPKYTYTPNLNTTLPGMPSSRTEDPVVEGVGSEVSSDDQSPTAHDHKYTKRKVKSIMV